MTIDWEETAEREKQKYYKRKQRGKHGSQYLESPVNKSISPVLPQLEIHNKKCSQDVIAP